MRKLKEEIKLVKKLLKTLEKGYGRDKCKGYHPGCPNCDWQLARGWLWGHLDLLESELKELK